VDGQRVEEFVAENNTCDSFRPRAAFDVYRNVAEFRKGGGHLASASPEFRYHEIRGSSHLFQELAHPGSDEDAEDRLNLLGSVIVTLFPERILATPVIPMLRVIESDLHEPVEGDGA
jgi:hypothetical protein